MLLVTPLHTQLALPYLRNLPPSSKDVACNVFSTSSATAMAKLRIQWRKVFSSEKIRRSSQIIAVNQESRPPILGIFSGELKPREPVDNNLHEVELSETCKDFPSSNAEETAHEATANLHISSYLKAPSPRVGSASATLNGHTYLFSGRGGQAMTPIDERGALWALSHDSNQWSVSEAANPDAPFPPARSYHALTSDKRDTLYLHAGCPDEGRLSDLWAFQLSMRRWISLADAPDPPRGGTSIAFCPEIERLYRMNGFDGKTEQGGNLDVYNPETDCWTSIAYHADGIEGPEARSVSALLCVTIASQPWLLTLFGERDPSNLGHAGAGKMLSDVWAWDVKGEAWTRVENTGLESPECRGWFAADLLGDHSVVVQGGLNEANERLGDVWVGKLEQVD